MFFNSRIHGFTIIELLATIVIMSVLAVLIAPMGTVLFFQNKELMLRENLREIRRAIDKYYDMNKRHFTNDPPGVLKNCYPFTWQDLYEGYLRKNYSLNPITYKFEDYDVMLDKYGIFKSDDYPGKYKNFEDMPYPVEPDTALPPPLYKLNGEEDTVLLSPEQFQLREYDAATKSIAVDIYTPKSVWWTDAGMFDVKFPSKTDPSLQAQGQQKKMMAIDGSSYYHEW
jgi:prepilin-type N-terminal cleavage/methylation domain-containing protein